MYNLLFTVVFLDIRNGGIDQKEKAQTHKITAYDNLT